LPFKSSMTQEFLKPEKILNALKLKKNIVAADFGCGSGGWVIPLAKILDEGKVYALDLLKEPLSVVKSRAKIENLDNIETILTDVEKTSRLPDDSCHLILMTNLLFQCDDKKKVLEEAKKVLKKNGKILVVDWKEDASFGPENRISIDELKKIAESMGYKIGKSLNAGSYHWALVLIK